MPRPAVAFLALTLTALAAASAHADITIGVAGPMSGTFGVLGKEMQTGAAQAVADINRAGGVNGQMLRLEAMDDGCDAKTADATANQLAGKGTVMVVGHVCLAASKAAADVYVANKIVEISPATTNPQFTDARAGPGIFRLAERDDQQPVSAGQFLANRFATRNVAIVNDGGPYGKKLADAVQKAMNAAGKREVFTVSYMPNAQDFSDVISKLRAGMVDAVFMGGSAGDIGRFVKQLRAAGLMTQVIAGDAIATDDFWNAAGTAGQGTLMTLPFDPRKNTDPAAQAVMKAFRDMGVEPEGYVLPSYAAVRIWAAAAANAKTFAFDQVTAALGKGSYPSVVGTVSFGATGDADLPGYVIYEWRDGVYDTLSH